jgi:hypothetical protein
VSSLCWPLRLRRFGYLVIEGVALIVLPSNVGKPGWSDTIHQETKLTSCMAVQVGMAHALGESGAMREKVCTSALVHFSLGRSIASWGAALDR